MVLALLHESDLVLSDDVVEIIVDKVLISLSILIFMLFTCSSQDKQIAIDRTPLNRHSTKLT